MKMEKALKETIDKAKKKKKKRESNEWEKIFANDMTDKR